MNKTIRVGDKVVFLQEKTLTSLYPEAYHFSVKRAGLQDRGIYEVTKIREGFLKNYDNHDIILTDINLKDTDSNFCHCIDCFELFDIPDDQITALDE